MESNSKHVLLACTLILLSSLATSDINKDKEKCQNQLISIATCLPYVSGEAQSPTSDCCTGFKQVLRDSLECVCILIKDRDDPSLGLKINATLALSLPARCKAPLDKSVTDCPAILHLPPNSPDAKVFDDFAKVGSKSNSTTAAPATVSSPSTANTKSTNGVEKVETRLISGLLILLLALQIIN